jgi:hypothetical protein
VSFISIRLIINYIHLHRNWRIASLHTGSPPLWFFPCLPCPVLSLVLFPNTVPDPIKHQNPNCWVQYIPSSRIVKNV